MATQNYRRREIAIEPYMCIFVKCVDTCTRTCMNKTEMKIVLIYAQVCSFMC